jgi:hypothetical protein
MIQRQQTLWLLLATVCAVLSFLYPFATGIQAIGNMSSAQQLQTGREELVAGSNLFILILTIISIVISTVAIFQFKDRRLQMRLCLGGLLVAVLIVVLYIVEMRKLLSSTPALWSLLSGLVILGYIMAYRGIRHDEKLVKSLDKLR